MGNQASPQGALQGRYSCKAQGASPGLIIETHLLSPARAALPHGKRSRRKCRSYGALIFVSVVYPGFHFGRCPHYTLGFEEVSCLRHSRQHHPINPTISANNDTAQQIRQQAQATTPNQSDNKRKQRHRIIIRTTNDRWGIRPIRKEPCKGGTTPRQMLTLKVPLLRSSYFLCPCLPRVAFRALPSFHPGLCRSVVPTALTPAPTNKSNNKRKQRHPTNN